MNERLTVRGQRIGSASPFAFREYIYRGDMPLEKDPEIHKSMTHGTASAARLHYLRGEKPCDACRESERTRWREASKKRKRLADRIHTREFTREKCGTNAGHQRHMYYSVPPCDECMEAHRIYQRARLIARREASNASSNS